MKDLKIIIGIPYFNRPKMVINALKSIEKADYLYGNWELVFLDDGSNPPGREIVETYLGSLLHKVKFYNSGTSPEDKVKHNINFSEITNQALKETDADISIALCDDDALYPTYLLNLNEFFKANPKINSCYSDMVIFNPLEENYDSLYRKYSEGTLPSENLATSAYIANPYGRKKGNHGPCCGAGRMDACQVAWRVSCNKEHDVWWPRSPRDHDFYFFEQLYHKTGPMVYSGFIGEFKGWHKKQLGEKFNQLKDIVNHEVDIDK